MPHMPDWNLEQGTDSSPVSQKMSKKIHSNSTLPIPQLAASLNHHSSVSTLETSLYLLPIGYSNCTIIHGDKYQVDSSQTTINVDSFNVKTTLRLQDSQPCPLGKLSFLASFKNICSWKNLVINVDSASSSKSRMAKQTQGLISVAEHHRAGQKKYQCLIRR